MLGILRAEGGCSPVGRVGVCRIGLISSSLMISSGSNSVPGVFLGSLESGIGVGEASGMVGEFSALSSKSSVFCISSSALLYRLM